MSHAHWITHSQTVTGWLPEAHVTPASLFCMSSHECKASVGERIIVSGQNLYPGAGRGLQPKKKHQFGPVNGRGIGSR